MKKEKQKKKIEASKLFTDLSFCLAFGFVIFCCYEMHRLQDLTPITYLGGGILILLGIVVNAYMKRAAAKDLARQKIYETQMLSKIKQKYGDNYQEGEAHDTDVKI